MQKPLFTLFIALALMLSQMTAASQSQQLSPSLYSPNGAQIADEPVLQITQDKANQGEENQDKENKGVTDIVIDAATDAIQSVSETDIITEAPKKTLLTEKLENEREANRNAFSLVQHNPNYLLPVSYSPNPNPISFDGANDEQIDRFEAKYQISVKTPLWLHQDDASGVYFGFTAVSFWQVYNNETSKPFRETNYQPEVFYQFNTDIALAGYKFNLFRVGLNHMSNGQSGLKSRSWNRITATALFSDENTAYFIRTWVRLPEDAKTSPLDPRGDDNPDINDYYGRVELGFGYRLGKFDITTSIRNNLSLGDNRSGVEINMTYPINKRYDLLIQLFNGYGDSLIDYNRHKQRVSIGMQIRFL